MYEVDLFIRYKQFFFPLSLGFSTSLPNDKSLPPFQPSSPASSAGMSDLGPISLLLFCIMHYFHVSLFANHNNLLSMNFFFQDLCYKGKASCSSGFYIFLS